MPYFNRIQIMGHLGKDPELRFMPDGKSITRLSIAYTEKWYDKKTGNPQEHTEWFNALLYGNHAETAHKYLKKGDCIQIAGKLKSRRYINKEQQEQTIFEIHATEMQMISSRPTAELPSAHDEIHNLMNL